ncbi:MAG TPA: FlgD immunoglobulin-like domain containing protein, partial [Candidatus Eisenbacteria bacterium]|nr:FlgD immunoglobulin-like domain containing protein [Candidatus Eisenbacteria bacterium]
STTLTVPLFVLPAGGALSSPTAAAAAPRAGLPAPQAPQRGPIVSVNGSNTGKSGSTLSLTATATDAGTTLAGRFTLQRAGQAGSAASQFITLTADLSGLPAINDAEFVVDEDPVVNVPGPVTAHVGVPVNVQVGAADPDGDPIEDFTADLTTLPTGNDAVFTVNFNNTLGTLSWTPTTSDSGSHFVTFTATNRLVGQNTVEIRVRGVAAARIFQQGAKKISLPSGKPFACVQIEPIDGSFSLENVTFASIGMISVGTGTVSRISASTGKSVIIGDRDGNLIEDLTVCFTKADLRLLFSSLRGSNSVPVVIEGNLATGGRFQGQITLEVNAGGGKLAAAIYPNPLNPRATLGFTTTKSGFVRVRLFDLNGRMVRSVLDAPTMDPGYHEVGIDGADAEGRRLASGVYFYRVEAREGSSQGRLAVVK